MKLFDVNTSVHEICLSERTSCKNWKFRFEKSQDKSKQHSLDCKTNVKYYIFAQKISSYQKNLCSLQGTWDFSHFHSSCTPYTRRAVGLLNNVLSSLTSGSKKHYMNFRTNAGNTKCLAQQFILANMIPIVHYTIPFYLQYHYLKLNTE